MQHLLNDLRVLRAHAGLMQSDAAYAAFIHSSIKRDADESCTPERNVRPRVDMGVLLSAFEQMAVKNLNPLANLLLAFDATPMDVRKWQRLSTALGERITILINGLGATDKPLWKTLYKKCFYNKPEDEGPLALPFHLRRKHAPNAEVPITWERLWWIHYERTWYWIRNFSVKAVIAQRPEVVVELTQEPKEIETCEQAYEVLRVYDRGAPLVGNQAEASDYSRRSCIGLSHCEHDLGMCRCIHCSYVDTHGEVSVLGRTGSSSKRGVLPLQEGKDARLSGRAMPRG